ncbi:CsbD family protein [Synechococcus sp. PCC 7336]|uniref:CsbD family protein n=1 Tax=Synechococcus sp. PCC 7336 TaxID=195250 RepID=UPI00034D15DA|nr:CsbD family protein [Synechococcus sp. PCC 7336]
MSIEERLKATAKNIEGKVQEAVGEITGNPEDKAEGQLKQAEAEAEHEIENLKDKTKEMID